MLVASPRNQLFILPGTFPGHAVEPRRKLRGFQLPSASSFRTWRSCRTFSRSLNHACAEIEIAVIASRYGTCAGLSHFMMVARWGADATASRS